MTWVSPDQVVCLATARGPVTLRPETSADQAFIAALAAESWPPAVAADPALAALQLRTRERSFHGTYPRARFDIVLREGVPAGRLAIDAPDGAAEAYVIDYALCRAARGGGLGRAILAALLPHFAARGQAVRATVLTTNTASRRMLEAVGFAVTIDDVPYLTLRWTPATAAAEGLA